MSVRSLHAQIHEVQTLLEELRGGFNALPIDMQNQVSSELARAQSTLAFYLESAGHPGKSTGNHTDRPSPGFNEAESWMGEALLQAQSAVWKWDLKRQTVQLSSELYEVLALEPSIDTSDPQVFIGMIHPEDRDAVMKDLQEAIKRGGPFYQEFRLIRGDGVVIWVNSAGTVQLDPSGQPIQAAGINQDITSRKQFEEALRESEAREHAKRIELEAIMDAVPAMIWISRDSECKEMVGNRYGYEFLEMWKGANISKSAPESDLAVQPYRNFKDGREIPTEELPMQIAAATGVGAGNYEFDLVFSKGITKSLFGNVIPLFDDQGQPTGAVAAFVDITERKQVEEELRRSEAQLKSWQEQVSFWSRATNSFFWVLDADGSYRDPSPFKSHISGKAFDQTVGTKWMEVVHPDDRSRLEKLWQDAIQEQKAFEHEARIWHGDTQQYRWFYHRAVPVRKDGQMEGWVGATIDIQARKEMEQALKDREDKLRKSEARERAWAAELQAILNAVPTPIIITRDVEAMEISGNLAAYEFLGARSSSNLALINRDDAATRVELATWTGKNLRTNEIPLRAVLRTGASIEDFEGTIRFKDGTEKVVLGNATPLTNSAGDITGAVGVFMDLTERISAERALRETEQRFQIALSTVPVVVFTMDRDLRYTWAYNTSRISYESMVGKRDDEIQSIGNAAELTALKKSVIETRQPVRQEMRVKIGESWFDYMITLDPTVDPDGQVIGLIGAVVDMTDQRRLEAEQRENAIRMTAQERLMETIESERIKIAREIHDGPIQSLVSILFAIQSVNETIHDSAFYTAITPVTESVQNTINELRQVVNELRPPTLVRFGLVRAIHSYCEDLMSKNGELQFSFEMPEESPPLPEKMSVTLFRIFQEALHNVIRHSNARRVRVNLAIQPGQLVMEVEDDGRGFDFSGDFDAFTEDQHFGLAGMKERVEAVGGNLLVSTEPVRGTRIKVTVPNEVVQPAER